MHCYEAHIRSMCLFSYSQMYFVYVLCYNEFVERVSNFSGTNLFLNSQILWGVYVLHGAFANVTVKFTSNHVMRIRKTVIVARNTF